MWLINNRTFAVEPFSDESCVQYAILSHTWEDDEVSMQDMKDLGCAQRKKGFAKIRRTCQFALDQGIPYSWVDTCCIDKTSSAELSEAINSMYRWYRCATVCFAFLADLDGLSTSNGHDKDNESGSSRLHKTIVDQLPQCRWFTRGWTLQELIAPKHMEFFDRTWTLVGTKSGTGGLLDVLSEITQIETKVLLDPERWLPQTAAFRKMVWASRRITTRGEDRAYSLLGIFDINMPMLYGEGSQRAFKRLQEEIMRSTSDVTLLAWSSDEKDDPTSRHGVLASDPLAFRFMGGFVRKRFSWSISKATPLDGSVLTLPLAKTAYTPTPNSLLYLMLEVVSTGNPDGVWVIPIERTGRGFLRRGQLEVYSFPGGWPGFLISFVDNLRLITSHSAEDYLPVRSHADRLRVLIFDPFDQPRQVSQLGTHIRNVYPSHLWNKVGEKAFDTSGLDDISMAIQLHLEYFVNGSQCQGQAVVYVRATSLVDKPSRQAANSKGTASSLKVIVLDETWFGEDNQKEGEAAQLRHARAQWPRKRGGNIDSLFSDTKDAELLLLKRFLDLESVFMRQSEDDYEQQPVYLYAWVDLGSRPVAEIEITPSIYFDNDIQESIFLTLTVGSPKSKSTFF